MKKSDIKKVLILLKREFQLNKKFLFVFVPTIIFLTIIMNVNFSEKYTKYLIVITIFFSYLLSTSFFIPQLSINIEKNRIIKSLKSFPVSNTHVFLSKLIFFFFSILIFYLIPIFLISIIGNVPKLLKPFLSSKEYWTYAIGLVFIFFTIGIINLIISYINSKIVGYLFNIVLFSIIIGGRIPAVKKFGDNINGKVFGETFMVNGFLKFSIIMFIFIIPLVFLGIKFVNSKIIYKLYEK